MKPDATYKPTYIPVYTTSHAPRARAFLPRYTCIPYTSHATQPGALCPPSDASMQQRRRRRRRRVVHLSLATRGKCFRSLACTREEREKRESRRPSDRRLNGRFHVRSYIRACARGSATMTSEGDGGMR